MRQLALAVVTVLALAGCTSTTSPEKKAEPSSSSSPSPVEGAGSIRIPQNWRTEVWHDLQLRVPGSWAPGYAPVPERGGALLCGVGPLAPSPDGPFVGRPGYGSDLCVRQDVKDTRLDREGVWFGSPVPVGEVRSDEGLVQRTVAVGGARVTVASTDARELRRVLGSIEQVRTDANGCPAEPRVESRYPDEGYGAPRSLSVCLYDERSADGWNRTWSARLPASAAKRLLDRLEAAKAARCESDRSPGQLLLLRITTDDPFGNRPLFRDNLVDVDSGCPTLTPGADEARHFALTAQLVRPWASDGVSTYVVGTGLPRSLQRFFRPVWG